MRAHGTRACYVHGPEVGSRNGGCRCEPCKAANRAAVAEAKDRTAPAYVSAGPARAHVEWLSGQGVGLKRVAKVSGVSHGSLWKIVYGRDGKRSKRIRPATAERILAVTPADVADGAKVPAGATWERLDALIAAGVPKAELARRLGQKGPGLQLSRAVVTAGHARAVAVMHDEYLAGEFTYVRRSGHGNRTVTLPAPEQADEQIPPISDDADRLLVEFVEILEARIDQAHWRKDAACRGRDTWVFFPARGDTRTLAAAQRICGACVVREQCLTAHHNERDGVYGGTTGKQRRQERSTAA